MSVKIKRFGGKFTPKMLSNWKLTEENGRFGEACEKKAKEAVAFVLNECFKDEVGGMSIYMPHPFDQGRLRNLGADSIRFQIGLTGGSSSEPYFETTITSLVKEYIAAVEEGFLDGRDELKRKLLACVAAIEKSQSRQ